MNDSSTNRTVIDLVDSTPALDRAALLALADAVVRRLPRPSAMSGIGRRH